jgi:hypothetical protein
LSGMLYGKESVLEKVGQRFDQNHSGVLLIVKPPADPGDREISRMKWVVVERWCRQPRRWRSKLNPKPTSMSRTALP